MVEKKIMLLVGPTGHGKSTIINEYCVGPNRPEIGHTIESETIETKSFECNVGGDLVNMFDTPGLGDTAKRDQKFLAELVHVLQDNCAGVHKVFFVMQVHESRFNSFLAICLTLLLELAPDLRAKPSVLTLVLSKANQGSDSWDPNTLPTKIQQLKNKIMTDFEMEIEIIAAGRGNMQHFERSVKNASFNVFSQTAFMVKVQTMDTKVKLLYEDLEKAKQENEAAQQHIGQLKTANDQANAAITEAQKQREVDQQKITELKGTCDRTAQEMADARKQYETVQQNFQGLQSSFEQANRESQEARQQMMEQMMKLQELAANTKVENHYHDDGGCLIS